MTSYRWTRASVGSNISRRHFIQSAMAAGLASAFPAYVVLAQPPRRGAIPSEIAAVTLDGSATSIEGAAVRELAESLQGAVLLRGDYGYDGARRLWNGMHDRHPALIVRAANARDVANAVTFARERELLLAVKGGGHSWPGRSVADDALMIDLAAMNHVAVDPGERSARAGGGTLIYNLDNETLKHGLVTTAGVIAHTGLGGLTLGGGYGRLNRKIGLTIDNLLSAELVTADGRVRRVSAEEDADLFWAIRGGGGNFGVATEFEYRLHEAGPQMLGGDLLWPLDQAREVLEFYAEYAMGLSEEMYIGPMLAIAPDGSGLLGMDVCYYGDLANGERELAPLREVGTPVVDGVAPTSYLALQTRLDGDFRPGIRSYIRSGMVREFTPGLIDTMLESFDPSRGVIIGTHTAGGAVARVGETDTAWPHRNAETMILAVSIWDDPAMDEQMIEANRDQWDALEPFVGGYYDNIQAEATDVPANFGPVYDRLVAVKNEFDPMNLFRLNSNIAPTV